MWDGCLFLNFVWEESFGNLNDMLKRKFVIEGLEVEMKDISDRHFKKHVPSSWKEKKER